jgi:subtilase family serine protease
MSRVPLAAAAVTLSLGAAGVAGATSAATASAAAPRVQRLGTPAQIPSGAQSLGAPSSSQVVNATVALSPRDPAALAALAVQVSTPGSPAYHRYLTAPEFAARFGATDAQAATVRQAMAAKGLSVGALAANRLSFDVSAPASAMARAFSVTLDRYRLPGGRTGIAPTQAPAVAPAIANVVQGVVGLDTLAVPRPVSLLHARRVAGAGVRPDAAAPNAAPVAPCASATSAGSRFGAYTPNQLAGAYGFDDLYSSGDQGAGTTVALYELEPYLASDIAAYQSCMGTDVPITNTSVDGGTGTGAGEGEAALDVEDVLGLAPGASIDVYTGPNTASGAFDTYSRIIGDDTSKVISTSWGLCESQEGSAAAQSESTLFQEAASQGQSIYAASGDAGADDCRDGSGRAVDDPASQPDVTGVGGTSLPSATGAAAQTVWNDGAGGGAGGGGVSTFWATPSYQSAVNSGGAREVPDVSADADEDTGYVIFYDGSWGAIGGTSAAAPLWAAFTALADSSSACSAGPVGLANPALYGASGDLTDITSGNNTYDGVTGFSAGGGYDLASGLGTPDAGSLAPALCGG